MIVSLPIKYNLPSAYKPVNYTAADNKIDTHLKGVDTVLGTLVADTTDASITGAILTGFDVEADAGVLAATDTILEAIEKLNARVIALEAV